MAINRVPFNALVDDDGTNSIGTPWNKTAIKDVILDPVDAALLNASGVVRAASGVATSTAAAYIDQATIVGGLALGKSIVVRLAVSQTAGPKPPLFRIDVAGQAILGDIGGSLPSWSAGPLIAIVTIMPFDTTGAVVFLTVDAPTVVPGQGCLMCTFAVSASFDVGLLIQEGAGGSTKWAWQVQVL